MFMRVVRLTTCRSAASGVVDAHSAAIFPPFVGCSGMLGRYAEYPRK